MAITKEEEEKLQILAEILHTMKDLQDARTKKRGINAPLLDDPLAILDILISSKAT